MLVGFSQGAILVNSYLLRCLQLISSSSETRVEHGQLVASPLPLPCKILAWAGTGFNFQTTFPDPGWPRFPSSPTASAVPSSQEQRKEDVGGYVVHSHQQCGSSDRYFSSSDITSVADQISKAGREAEERCTGLVVKATAEMEVGGHSVLPGMTATLIEMVQRVISSS